MEKITNAIYSFLTSSTSDSEVIHEIRKIMAIKIDAKVL